MPVLAPRTALPKLTDRIPLGDSGLAVSPFCSGLTLDARQVPAAYEAGINFFFISADMHWPVYEPLRRGLRMLLDGNPAARDDLVIAVASYVTQPEFCSQPFIEVLEEVPQLARLDLLIAGGAYDREIDVRVALYNIHRTQRFAGCRAIGATFHERAAAVRLLATDALDIALVRYNPLHPRAATEVFPHVKSRADGRRTLLYNFKSTIGWITSEEEYLALGIAPGFWRPHPTDYYRFALTEPALDGILCGLPDAAAVRDLADALEKGPLDDEDRQYLLDLGDLQKGRAKVVA
jgi:hypothetical protein